MAELSGIAVKEVVVTRDLADTTSRTVTQRKRPNPKESISSTIKRRAKSTEFFIISFFI